MTDIKNTQSTGTTEELLLEKLGSVEQQIKVEDLTYNGYHVWPILKDRLFFDALFKQAKTRISRDEVLPGRKETPAPPSFLHQLKKSLKGYFSFRKKTGGLSKAFANAEFIFLDGSNGIYIDTVNGAKYSRYLSPYFEYVNKLSGALLLNFTKEEELTGKLTPSLYYNINSYFSFLQLKTKIVSKVFGKKLHLNGFDDLKNKLKELNYPGQVNIQNLGYMIEEIENYKAIYNQIFKHIKPQGIFIECYYGNPNYLGAILAAKEKSIRVIDIQHGVSFDPMYLGWDKIPSKGCYEFLPDNFWVWSRYDVDNISDSRGEAKQLSPVAGGNLWYKKYLETKQYSDEDKALQALSSNFKKTILITLDHSGPIYDCLLDAIERGPKTWLWLVRFHPHDYKDPGYREKYIREFSRFSNVHYENSTKCSLYNLLELVDLNISRYSSVCIEALTFKVPSIIIMCEQKIKQLEIFEKTRCFQYSSDGSEIVEIIRDEKIKVDESNYDFFRMRYEDSQIKTALEISVIA